MSTKEFKLCFLGMYTCMKCKELQGFDLWKTVTKKLFEHNTETAYYKVCQGCKSAYTVNDKELPVLMEIGSKMPDEYTYYQMIAQCVPLFQELQTKEYKLTGEESLEEAIDINLAQARDDAIDVLSKVYGREKSSVVVQNYESICRDAVAQKMKD